MFRFSHGDCQECGSGVLLLIQLFSYLFVLWQSLLLDFCHQWGSLWKSSFRVGGENVKRELFESKTTPSLFGESGFIDYRESYLCTNALLIE